MPPNNEAPQQQPVQSPEQQLQSVLKTLSAQLQTPGADQRYEINLEPVRKAAISALQASPGLLTRIQNICNALYPNASAIIPDVKTAIDRFSTSLPVIGDRPRLTQAQRDALIIAINALNAPAPLANPEIQTKVKQALARTNTELDALRKQVQQTQKSTEELRKNAAESMVALRNADSGRYQSLVTSLRLTLTDAVTANAADIARSLEGLDKRAQDLENGLRTLRNDVGGNPPVAPPNADIQRRAGMLVGSINGVVNRLYAPDSQVGKFLSDYVGTPEEVRDMILSGITDILGGLRAQDLGLPAVLGRSIEGAARNISDELKFQDALSRYTGDRSRVDDAWRTRYLTRLHTWERNTSYYNANHATNSSLQNPGPRPTIEQAAPGSPELVNYEEREKTTKDAAAKKTEEEGKAKKEAAADLAEQRTIDDYPTPLPGGGLEITGPIQPVNIGNNRIFIEKTPGGDFRMKIHVNGQENDHWIAIRTQNGATPNRLRLCIPRRGPNDPPLTIANARLLMQAPDGTPQFWQNTQNLTLRSINERVQKSGIRPGLTLSLLDDNSDFRLQTPEELKKQQSQKMTKEQAEKIVEQISKINFPPITPF